MSVTSPDYLDCSQDIVTGLIETVSVALTSKFPAVEGDPFDIELVLDAVRVLRPKLAELEAFTGLLHMLHGRWDDAVRVFSWVIANAPQFSYAKALLAFCLAVKGDPGWRLSATEAIEQDPNRDTLQLVRVLEAREDLRAAVRVYRNGGKFELPPSIAALNEESQAAAAGSDTPAESMSGAHLAEAMPQQSYLRI
ncbi:HrpB1 family type III secretion system apparatus protein [Trinickia sp.]|uniref:HrpB1 family type III secretion system apparatus protein n=1 Tax=Trinickia sp. TaxID=2571163 RepID=UPI003F7DCDC6